MASHEHDAADAERDLASDQPPHRLVLLPPGGASAQTRSVLRWQKIRLRLAARPAVGGDRQVHAKVPRGGGNRYAQAPLHHEYNRPGRPAPDRKCFGARLARGRTSYIPDRRRQESCRLASGTRPSSAISGRCARSSGEDHDGLIATQKPPCYLRLRIPGRVRQPQNHSAFELPSSLGALRPPGLWPFKNTNDRAGRFEVA